MTGIPTPGTASPEWGRIPEPIRASLRMYCALRTPVDGCLYAILSDRFLDAIPYADPRTLAAMIDIGAWMIKHLPMSMYGLVRVVDGWLSGTELTE